MTYLTEENGDIAEVLLSADELAARVRELGETISRDYQGKPLLLVGVLKGSCPFLTDLMRHIDLPLRIDFMSASSYGNSTLTAGKLQVRLDLSVKNPEAYHILLVEDILDTGITISSLCDLLRSKKPLSFRSCVLLDKPERRRTPVTADYVGFSIEDKFVVGYGLDYAEQYRNLPYVGVLKPALYS